MNTFIRSLSYLKKYRWYAIGAFIMMNIVTLCSLILPQFIQRMIDDGVTAKNLSVIKEVSGYLLALTVVQAISSFTNTYWSQKASQGIAYDIRNELYKKLEYLQISFHDKNNIGQLLTRTTNDVDALRNFFGTGLLEIIAAIVTLIGSIGILVNTDARLFLSVAGIIPLVVVIFFFIFKKLTPIFALIQKNLGQLNNILQENIMGIRVVKAFTAEPLEHQKYEQQNQRIYQENINMVKVFSAGFPSIFFLSNLATVIVLWVGGNTVINDNMTVGRLIAFNSYLSFLVQPIFRLGMIMQQFARSNASADRIFSILDFENTIVNRNNPISFSADQSGEIRFANVNFSYTDNSDELILKNINLTLEPGSNTAIIGATGSGKSSLINLIPRFYDATAGVVSIDGINVENYELESLRQNIGMVLQEIRLINGSIRENIRYGRPDATDEEVLRVAKIAQVDNFLDNYPDGLDFQIGEGGKNLSGGQRQRVAIARMLLVKPKIVILDDATSALDAVTESDLVRDAQPFLDSKKHTVLFISQKMSMIRRADKIIVMENGTIVSEGTHDQLMQTSLEYQNLLNAQIKQNELVE